MNDPAVMAHLKQLLDQKEKARKELAAKKREEMMRKMKEQKDKSKFLKQIASQGAEEEEAGPKCVTCFEGYTKKPNEALGLYVYCKKAKLAELSASGQGYTHTQGYSTVTHSNFIHFVCH